jgi:hypothetical protein
MNWVLRRTQRIVARQRFAAIDKVYGVEMGTIETSQSLENSVRTRYLRIDSSLQRRLRPLDLVHGLRLIK